MVEKNQLVHDLLFKYSGPLVVQDFFKEIEVWIGRRGLTKEIKRKSEDTTAAGKKIEWIVEAFKSVRDDTVHLVRMRVLMNNVKEARVKRKGKTIRFQNVDMFVRIDGWIESSIAGRWTQNAIHYFVATLIDKYIWMTSDRYHQPVIEDCYDLHRRLKSFCELSKIKVA